MDDLQFDKAEYANPGGIGPCVSCGALIREDYWKLNGHVICPQCGTTAKTAQKTPKGTVLLSGALYALGAAVVCAIAYAAILIVMKYDLALIAIAVGWLIGTAARKGTSGLGGRPLQIVAVAATYIAICGSFFGQVVWELRGEASKISYPLLFLFSLGKPVLEMREGFQGIIGLVILFFGLLQAWKQTGNLQATLEGPLRVEALPQT